MLTFYFTGAEGCMTVPELLTAGMMGKELRLEFSDEWNSITKTVVFSNGETTLDRLYTGETMVIPAQVLEKPLEKLTVGIYGVSEDGLLVIPTIRAEGPVILPGVDPAGDPGVDPSLPVWAQLREMVERMEALVEEEKEKLVAAIDELFCRVEKSPAAAYYGSLAEAISDLNNGMAVNALAAREGAKVAVFTAHTGAKTVMLLDDVSESAGITVNKDIDLVLYGRKLNLTTPASVLTFGAGTKCRINGEVPGSAIVKEVSGATASTNVILTDGEELHISGGRYAITGTNTKTNLPIKATTSAGLLEVNGATVEAVNPSGAARPLQLQNKNTKLTKCTIRSSGASAAGLFNSSGELIVMDSALYGEGASGKSYAIYHGGTSLLVERCELYASASANSAHAIEIYGDHPATVRHSTIFADAPDCHMDGNCSRGIISVGELFVDDCTVFGTHSGIECHQNAYINGGTYTGFCHGGVYISGTNRVSYLNDATLRCGNYEGQFDYSGKTGEIYGSMYIGGDPTANGLTAYLDGCAITNEGGHPIVMRGTDGEHDNAVYISNSTVLGTIRIDNDTLKLYVGVGTNIETYKIDNPARAEFSRKLYRKNSGEKLLDGGDYHSLAAWIEDAAGLVKSVGGVQADKNGNVPLAWVATDDFQSVVILEESSVSSGFTSAFSYEDLQGQEELAVLCDGRLYLCVPEFGYSEGDGYYVYLGNKSLLSTSQTDSGEPFLVWGYKGTRLVLSFREGGSHTMSITGYRYGYTKLPAKYLPEDAIRAIVEAVLAEK